MDMTYNTGQTKMRFRILITTLIAVFVINSGTSYADLLTYDFVNDFDDATQVGSGIYDGVTVNLSATHVDAGQLFSQSLPGLDLLTNGSAPFGIFEVTFSKPVNLEVDFWNLTGAAAERFQNFSVLPTQFVSLAPSHTWTGSALHGGGIRDDISTFRWNGITALTFESGDSVPGGSDSVQEIALRLNAVPEPSSACLTMIVLGIFSIRRRRIENI